MWSIGVGAFPDEEDRSSYMKLNYYSQHDFISEPDGVRWRYTAQTVPVT